MQSPENKYRPDIDGLRAIAVIAVVAFHGFPDLITGGFIGVDIFFVISGYLISTIIFEGLYKGDFYFLDFYARRIRRIFPALLLVLVMVFVFGWFELSSDEYKQLGKHIAAGAGFVSNLAYWSEAGYFDNLSETKPLLHLWSLGIEEQFYIFWPLLLWVFWKRNFNFLTTALILTIASFALNAKGVRQDSVAAFYSPHSRFWELSCGSLLAWLALYKKQKSENITNIADRFLFLLTPQDQNKGSLANIFSFAGLFLVAYGFGVIDKTSSFPGKLALIPVAGAALIIAAGNNAWFNRIILSNKVAVWLGLISFPLYLWHWPLLSFARIIEGDIPSPESRLAIILLSILLAWLTYKFVELPLRFGDRRKSKTAALVGLMIIVGYVGYNTYKRNGFSFRDDEFASGKMPIQRKDLDSLLTSWVWYRGKNDWLFLGNNYNKEVSKLKLTILPKDEEIENTVGTFSALAKAGSQFNSKVVLFVGPNKTSIYPEHLPDHIAPSAKKYSSFFLDRLGRVPNLTVYNPTDDLLQIKNTEGIIYWMTDTHWNNKGAFIAYSHLLNRLALPVPQVDFVPSSKPHRGDIIGLSNLKEFPLHAEDNWDVAWRNRPTWIEKEIPDEEVTAFGAATVVDNQNPLSNKYVWVCGDSFSLGLRQYFNATFKEIRYVGHWDKKSRNLPFELVKADRKPDIIFVVIAERRF